MKESTSNRKLEVIPKMEKYIQYMLEVIIKIPRTEKYSIGTEYKTSMYETIKCILVEIRTYAFYAFYAIRKRDNMNAVFLIGKLIKDVEYKFMLERNKTAKAILYLKLLDKTEIKVVGYNEIADFCLRNLEIKDIVIIYGKIEENIVKIIDIEKC